MIYENHFYTTKEMYKEFVNKVLCRKIWFMGIAAVAIGVVSLILGGILVKSNLIMLSFACLFWAVASIIIAPRTTLKNLLNYDYKLHRGENPECIVSFESNIKMKEGRVSIEIEYDQITALYKLKTCNILMFTKQNGIMYVSDGFAGESSDFEEFILKKCKNLKRIISR